MSPPSSSSGNESDDLSAHVTKITPGNLDTDVSLDSKITVFFDRDVRTVNINKLFEVRYTLLVYIRFFRFKV